MTPSASWNNFDTMADTPPVNLLWVSTGDAGTGKSYFACTAPGPIWVAAFDPFGMNRVDKTIIAGKEVRIGRYPFKPGSYDSKETLKKAATVLWKRFLEEYAEALKFARTIIWDREDMAYKLQRYSDFGGTSAAPKDYEDLYLEYVGLMQDAGAAGINLGLLRGVKEQWVSKWDASKQKMVGNSTGLMIPDGNKKVNDLVDVTLFHRWNSEEKQYVTKIDKFTNPDYRGLELPNLTFGQMAYAAFPDSDEERWL